MVALYDRMGLAPQQVGMYYKSAWADLVENGLVSPSLFNSRSKRTHVRGYQKGAKTARNMRVRLRSDEHLDEQIQRESRYLPKVALPLVLKFVYNPHGFMYPEIFALTERENNTVKACWTCVTKIGTFVVIKHDEKKYEAFLVRSHQWGDDVLISRTLGQKSNSRAGSMANLCGQAWVMNMGKPYSLYDLYTEVTHKGATRSVWFKFEDESIPKKNINAVIFDKNAAHAQWVWAANSQDMRWQPRPAHRAAPHPDLHIPRFPVNLPAGYFPQRFASDYAPVHHYIANSELSHDGDFPAWVPSNNLLLHTHKRVWNSRLAKWI